MNLPKVIGEYKMNYRLQPLTWFKVGGEAAVFFKPCDEQDLASFLAQNQQQLQVTVLGAGSNTIIRDGGVNGVVVKLGQNFTHIKILDNNRLSVGSGCLNFNLAKFCQANFITGFEFLIGIPGTIGGGVVMNAGSYGAEFKDLLIEIEALDPFGNLVTFSNEEIGFRYRGSNLPEDLIVIKAIFKTVPGNQDAITARMNEITQKRSATQPIKERTGGSTFANPEGYSAWQLIDKAGMRGAKVGDASMSTLHCNFMINHGTASARDLEDLGELVRKKVLENSGINLKWEIRRIGKYA